VVGLCIWNPTMLHDKPDDGPSFSSGSGVGLAGSLDKPDANHKLESRIGTGLLALRVGFVGLG
jgi:hypothetical protein